MTFTKARRVTLGAERYSFIESAEVAPMPNLNNVQRESFDWFLKEGLKEVFAEMSPIDPSPRNTEV